MYIRIKVLWTVLVIPADTDLYLRHVQIFFRFNSETNRVWFFLPLPSS